jgi:hypothetical protein
MAKKTVASGRGYLTASKKNRYLGFTVARSWIWPTTIINLEADSPPQALEITHLSQCID